ncbi:signal transduction histidine kinase [Mucilaginibacter sp. UYP25]|uniref:HAMP domain-containing sensor histidine kinase n=1 Tax=unclassified Mucilaginibacter TaxID=2617802 RepID=UPI0033912856
MSNNRATGIFRRIGLLIFIVVTVLSILFVIVTYMATTEYYQASTQLLNKDVAAHIAKFSSPFEGDSVNRRKADSVFFQAMVISPNVEVYFLNNDGKVISYHAADSLIKIWAVPLDHIQQYLADPNQLIRSVDPKDPETPKIFSAAKVFQNNQQIGYIYVILVSKEYRNVADFVFRSRIGGLAIKIFGIIVLTTLTFSILYTFRLQSRFNRVIRVLDKFRDGDLNERFDASKKDEFYPISDAFNKMACMLETNFNRLKALEEERRDFLAHISHDLRTPLSVARGYTETLLIEKNASASEQQAHLELVNSKIRQVEKLVLQLFELSKMESVSFSPVKEPFIISEVLQELVSGAQLQGRVKEIRIICENCEDPSMISADISMLERVLQNLLENALKYTPEQGEITISLTDKNGQLVVMFENTGEHLSKEMLTWLNSEGDSLTNRPQHSGLGLALVKKILKLHQFLFKAGVAKKHNYFRIEMPVYQSKS